MNITKRLFLGVFSTLLLAAGFAQAADRFDPIALSLNRSVTGPLGDDGPPSTPTDPDFPDDGSDSQR
jgi:hypothetical protein